MSELIRRVNCRACGRTHFGLWSQDGETVKCPIDNVAVYVATGKVVSEVPDYLTDDSEWTIANETEAPTESEQPEKKEIELDGMTVKELKELAAWENVPEPKPTRKADIIAAIEAVM